MHGWKWSRWATVPVVTLVAGCALRSSTDGFDTLSHATRSDVPLPSDLNAQAKALDGRTVVLRGYLVHKRESYAIWDGEAQLAEGSPEACVSLLYPIELRERVSSANRSSVYIKGVFVRDVTEDGGYYLGLCNFSGVRVSAISKKLKDLR